MFRSTLIFIAPNFEGDGTPGPNYRPNSRYWTRGSQKSMGIARKQKVANGPGTKEQLHIPFSISNDTQKEKIVIGENINQDFV